MFIQITRQNHPIELSIDDKAINNFLPFLSNNWVTFSSETHQYEISSRSNPPEVLLGKGVLKICSKFTAEHPSWSAISIKLQSNFIEITLRHWCSPVNCCIFSEHLFLRTRLGGCFWSSAKGLLKIPLINTKSYGKYPVKASIITPWNKIQKQVKDKSLSTFYKK